MKRGKVLHSGVRKINELWNALFPETVRYVPNHGLSLTVLCGLEARELCGQVEALGVERVTDHVVERVVDGPRPSLMRAFICMQMSVMHGFQITMFMRRSIPGRREGSEPRRERCFR